MSVLTLPVLSETIDLDAPPDAVYAMVSDVTRMGEWSPECYRAAWLDGAGPAAGRTVQPGDQFRGWNRKRHLRWSTVCEVRVADGTTFAFDVVAGASGRRTAWRYMVEPLGRGSRLTEVCEPRPLRPTFGQRVVRRLVVEPLRGRRDRAEELAEDIRATLAAIKRAAERR